MPEANEMFVGILTVVAQAERKMISERTKAALAAAKGSREAAWDIVVACGTRVICLTPSGRSSAR
jgi:DNA invertase Pin-like site-specific DNA recombinase